MLASFALTRSHVANPNWNSDSQKTTARPETQVIIALQGALANEV